jgi:uncharacterized protein DUF3224
MRESYKGCMTTAKASLQVQNWDEQTYDERDGARKLTQANVQQSITGDIEGSTDVRWIMAYASETRSEYVGIQVVTGTIGGKEGAFVLRSVGTFADGVATADVTVVEGSGTGELEGITGSGSFSAPMGEDATMTLDYELA